MVPADLFKRYFWLINIAFVVAVAFLSASVVNTKIRSKIEKPPKVDVQALKQWIPNAPPKIEDYNVILQRDVFNSASVLAASLEKKGEIVPINTEYDLVGTVAWTLEKSLALIQTKAGGAIKIYRVGDQLETGGKIVDIKRREVSIDRGGKIEVLQLPEFDLAAKLRSGTGGKAENVAEGIKKYTDGDYVVDRRMVDNAFDNMGQLMRQARIMPNLKNGKIDGFKVSNIKKDSLYDKIGIKDGDVVRNINGITFNGPEDFLKVFEVLRNAKSINIDVTRGGSSQSLSYAVR